jgi:hypothetical protein
MTFRLRDHSFSRLNKRRRVTSALARTNEAKVEVQFVLAALLTSAIHDVFCAALNLEHYMRILLEPTRLQTK